MGSCCSSKKKPQGKTQGTAMPTKKRSLGRSDYNSRVMSTYMPSHEEQDTDEKAQGSKLAEFLRQMSPFNGRWDVSKTLNSGSYGVVFECEDVNVTTTKVLGVIKVVKDVQQLETLVWEGFVGKKMQETNPTAGIARVLDEGKLQDSRDGRILSYIVLEKLQLRVPDYLEESTDPRDYMKRVTKIALCSFKAIYDLHQGGFLHRDIKPDNMALHDDEHPVAMLFDLGTCRLYTDEYGNVRFPRTVVPYRGTVEYASLHALKGREQTRWDDLIAWMYCMLEIYNPLFKFNLQCLLQLPWTSNENIPAVEFMKSPNFAAHALLRYCPEEWFPIRMHLYLSDPRATPDYEKIKKLLETAYGKLSKKPKKNRKKKPEPLV